MQPLHIINPEKVSETEWHTYPVRQAARAVVTDKEGNIALLYVKSDNSYKLPGGGIEANEDPLATLQRECLEEIGCEIEVTQEIGKITEYRKFCTLTQISFCYVAKLKGEKGIPHFMPDEIAEGFEEVWLPYEEAWQRLSENKALSLEGKLYIVPRDTLFLQTFHKLFM